MGVAFGDGDRRVRSDRRHIAPPFSTIPVERHSCAGLLEQHGCRSSLFSGLSGPVTAESSTDPLPCGTIEWQKCDDYAELGIGCSSFNDLKIFLASSRSRE
jgi:hypothetical protein